MLHDEYRKKLYDSLLGDISILPDGHPSRPILERCASDQLEKLIPIIEEIIRSEMAGSPW